MAESQASTAIGRQLREAAKALHGALERLETAVEQRRQPPLALNGEQVPLESYQILEQENAALAGQMQELQTRFDALSAQYLMVSRRLDTAIEKLTKVLQDE